MNASDVSMLTMLVRYRNILVSKSCQNFISIKLRIRFHDGHTLIFFKFKDYTTITIKESSIKQRSTMILESVTSEVIKEMKTTPSAKGIGSISLKTDDAREITGNFYSFY